MSAYNGSYYKFGFEIEAPNLTKKKANTTAFVDSKDSPQGHPFPGWVLSAGDMSARAGTNPPLSCETS